MRPGRAAVFLSSAAGVVVVAVSVFGFTLLRKRPGLPEGVEPSAVVRMDGIDIRTPGDLDFLLSRRGVGGESRVVLRRDGVEGPAVVRLVPFYSRLPYPVLFFAGGLAIFLLGFLVLGLKSGDARARIFFWMALSFAAAFVINGDVYCVRATVVSLLPGLFFNFFFYDDVMQGVFSIFFSFPRLPSL
jgi:hypothetical protein